MSARPASSTSGAPLRPSPASPTAMVVAFGIFLVLAIAALAATSLWQLRQRALQNAERELANLNHVLTEHTSRAVQSVDLVLKSTIESLDSLSPAQRNDAEVMHRMLRARIAGMPQVTVLMIVDGEGRVTHSTRSVPPPKVNLADLPYFIRHRENPGLGLLINAPRKSKVDGKWSLYFTRGLYGPDGSFMGMVDALVDPAYFDEFYRNIKLGDGSAVALLARDGILLTRYPMREDLMGQSLAHGALFTQVFPKASRGVVRASGVVDDTERILSGQLLADYPLAVNVSVTVDAALKEWRRWAALISSGALAATLLLVALLTLISRQLRRQELLTQDLALSEGRLKDAQRIANLGGWVYQASTDSFEWSEESQRLLGWTGGGAPANLARFLDLVHEADRDAAERLFGAPGAANEDGATRDAELRLTRMDGEPAWMHLVAHPVMGPAREIARINGTLMDITERQAAQERLRLAASVFERSTEANMVVDRDGHIVSVNQAFTHITGYAEAEVVGRNPRLLNSGRHPKEYYRDMWERLRDTGHWEGEIWNRRKDGEVFPERMSIEAARDGRGNITHYIAIFNDISERKAAENRIQSLAYYDPLTSLPNRLLLRDRVEQALAGAHRAATKMAILFLDLDRFKNINDSLGHHAGDMVLQTVAERLQHCIREVDTVARHGGDEFIVVLPGTDTEGAARVAQKVIDTLSVPLSVMGRELAATPSVGIAMFPDDGHDAEALIKNADAAMYHAKSHGRANYQFFTHEMNERAFEALAMESSLHRAFERNEFFLVYQPQIDVETGAVVGVEALLRWRHPEMGIVLPHRFIPIAEENGLIAPLGQWVLTEACRQNRAWQDAGLPPVAMAVNLSAAQFRRHDLAQMLREVLAATQLDPRWLELEMTESVVMQDTERVVKTLHELKAMGLRLAIDDFGTGYSSLSYLKRFPIDRLKIDQSFVRDIASDDGDAAITRSIIGLARDFALSVIAEGVENEEQLEFLRAAGCELIQGYLMSVPVGPESIPDMLREGTMAMSNPPVPRRQTA